MKKIISILLLACTLTLCLVSCGECKHDDASQVWVLEAKQPTCQETGLTAGKKCLICGEMIIVQATVDKISCIESAWIVDKKPNYDEDGRQHTECIMCGKVFKNQTLKFEVDETNFFYVKTGDTCKLYYVETVIPKSTDVIVPKYYKNLLVTGLYYTAFMKKDKITSITMPNSITKIESFAFWGCDSLKYIIFDGTKEEWKAIEKEDNWSPKTKEDVHIPFKVYCNDGTLSYN